MLRDIEEGGIGWRGSGVGRVVRSGRGAGGGRGRRVRTTAGVDDDGCGVQWRGIDGRIRVYVGI